MSFPGQHNPQKSSNLASALIDQAQGTGNLLAILPGHLCQFPVIRLPQSTRNRYVPALAQNHDFVLIDGHPPRVNELARVAILASNAVLIPVQPFDFDVLATKEIVDLLQK